MATVAVVGFGLLRDAEAERSRQAASTWMFTSLDDERLGYPDASTRELYRQATESRPVERSALPPRHLDAELHPHSLVDRELIVSGGPPPDGIPSIDEPVFEPVSQVDWLADEEAVLALELGGASRAYPVRIMVWHEIVNDEFGGVPVSVTYCPICNSAVAFEREFDGDVLDFGTSGTLYQGALVMYDRQTESLWTHFDGRAVIGTLVGAELELVPVQTLTWDDYRTANPGGQVLSRDTGYRRAYGDNPYSGFHGDRSSPPFTYGDVDDRLDPMAPVVGLRGARERVAVDARISSARWSWGSSSMVGQ